MEARPWKQCDECTTWLHHYDLLKVHRKGKRETRLTCYVAQLRQVSRPLDQLGLQVVESLASTALVPRAAFMA